MILQAAAAAATAVAATANHHQYETESEFALNYALEFTVPVPKFFVSFINKTN